MGPDLFEYNPISSTKMTESTTNSDLGRKLSDLVQNIESNKVNSEFPTKDSSVEPETIAVQSMESMNTKDGFPMTKLCNIIEQKELEGQTRHQFSPLSAMNTPGQ